MRQHQLNPSVNAPSKKTLPSKGEDGFTLSHMKTAPDPNPDDAASLTIKDVADACGLPQPAIAQLVPRTWTAEGWMYTPRQRKEAIRIAAEMRASKSPEGRGNARLRKLLADPDRAERVAQIRQQMGIDDNHDVSQN